MTNFERAEEMYVGSLIAYGEQRKTGYQLAEQHNLNATDLTTPALQTMLGIIRICESKYQLIPTVENLVDIAVSEGLSPAEPEETAEQHKLRVRKFVERIAKAGYNNEKMFRKGETAIALLSRERQAKEAATKAVELINSDTGTLTDKLDAVHQAFQDIGQVEASSAIYTLEAQEKAMLEFVRETRQGIQERRMLMTLPPALGGIAASIPSLEKGLLHVIKGFTKGGKSSCMGQISEWIAACGWKVAYFAFEDDVTRRLRHQTVRLVDGADYKSISMGDPNDYIADAMKIRRGWQANGGEWFYVHCPGKSMSWVLNTINKIQNTYGLDAVFVDYLQKVNIREMKTDNEYAGYTAAIELFKQRIEDRDRPLVGFIASQITEGENGKTHTRGTKDLEMRAQRVIMIKNNVAKMDEVFGGVTLAKEGQLSVWSTFQIEYNNDGPSIEEKLMFWRPRYSFYAPAYLARAKNQQILIPAMREPTQAELEQAANQHKAYYGYGAQGIR